MPTDMVATHLRSVARRWWPEILLALLSGLVFLGCLGSVELWGKREQRASAEAIDTLDHKDWLVAEIQGRPRLEKPPLPRWSIAALMILTGRRDETMVRLPGAIAGVLTVALIYLLGRRIEGRTVGLAAAFVLCSTGFFVGEMRQASNDGLLALFTTLALYAAYRLIHDDDEAVIAETRSSSAVPRRRFHGLRASAVVFHAALGLGFLTKGPVIVLIVGVTVGAYLAFSRRLPFGLRRLCDGWGLTIFAIMALSWPVAVLLNDGSALAVWSLEITEKTGFTHILEHRRHAPLLGQFPGMVLPWTLIAGLALLLPFLTAKVGSSRGHAGDNGWDSPGRRGTSPGWFAWWWAVGNMAVMSLWSVAKPNYYLPCLPGMALLIGAAWVHLARMARGQGMGALASRVILQVQWVSMAVAAALAPIVVRPLLPPMLWPWTVAIALAVASSVAFSAYVWRRGSDALALASIATACVFGIVIAYGIIAPAENKERSHRVLAERLREVIPRDVRVLRFFNEIDEGLWFYLSGFDLAPVPGTQPRYNTAYDLADSYRTDRRPAETLFQLEARRQARDKDALVAWLDSGKPSPSYLLIRGSLYDRFAGDLAGRVIPVFRETGMKRNELILLQVADQRVPPATASANAPARR
jgi:4-amino-4-deoxy-L-arabinose transferase-like glycosyltransferase